MAVWSDTNGFPESGFPILANELEQSCIGTFYSTPLKLNNLVLDVVGDNRLLGSLVLGGGLSGVTSLSIGGALSGATTIGASDLITLSGASPLTITNENAVVTITGLNASFGTTLSRVNKGFFKNLEISTRPTVLDDYVALVSDLIKYAPISSPSFSGVVTAASLKIGDTSNYTEFESDGTLKMIGNATVFDDLIADVTNVKTQGSGVSLNTTESTIDYTTGANTSDYILANYQMTHRWKAGSNIFPHIHWEQAQNNIPNWLIQYRWQRNGGAKTTAWTNYKCTTNAFTYVSGTLNQLSYGAAVTAPVGYSISDIIEFRVIRDTANTSTLFTGADPYTTTAGITSVDIHLEFDTLGSRSEYAK